MIKTRKELKECLKYEKQRYKVSFVQTFLGVFGLSEKGIIWNFQKKLRKYEYYINSNKKILSLLMRLRLNKFEYKHLIIIPPNVFGIGLKIMHLGSILINGNSKVGKNCVLHSGVCFIATNGSSFAPCCGDDCKLGVNSILIGNISIGNDIAIGAGSVLTKSFIENHVTIAGNPARIISNKGIL